MSAGNEDRPWVDIRRVFHNCPRDLVRCLDCGGSGIKHDRIAGLYRPRRCPSCNGQGKVEVSE